MTLVGLESVYFEAQVPETEATSLAPKLPVAVTVDALPGRTLTGVVSKIIPVVTTSSRDFRVRVSLGQSEQGLLSPGAFARGQIHVGRRENTLLVPKDALQTALGESYLFLVKEGRAKRSPVEVGWSEVERVEILEGAEEGDQVVVVGGSTLRDGDRVRILH